MKKSVQQKEKLQCLLPSKEAKFYVDCNDNNNLLLKQQTCQ